MFLVLLLQNRLIDSGIRDKQEDLRQHEDDLKRAKGMQLMSYSACLAWKRGCLCTLASFGKCKIFES